MSLNIHSFIYIYIYDILRQIKLLVVCVLIILPGILETAENLPYECASICSFCSRMKRGRIYAAARRGRYNVLALGQHLDDLAERSALFTVFSNIYKTKLHIVIIMVYI